MIEITRAELEKKYLSSKNKELAAEFGISEHLLQKLLHENGIKFKGRGQWVKQKIKIIK